MLYAEIIVVCSQIHTKHKYAVWAERRIAECETGGTYSDHWSLNDPTSKMKAFVKSSSVCSQQSPLLTAPVHSRSDIHFVSSPKTPMHIPTAVCPRLSARSRYMNIFIAFHCPAKRNVSSNTLTSLRHTFHSRVNAVFT
jgi:hypothetical protein